MGCLKNEVYTNLIKLNHNDIIPLIFEANLYFLMIKLGDFIIAVIEKLVNLFIRRNLR